MNNRRQKPERSFSNAASDHSEIFWSASSSSAGKPARRNGRHSPNKTNHPHGRPSSGASSPKVPTHVAELRALMRDQWVLVVTYICDTDSRALLSAVHLESRGLMLPQNGKALHAQIVQSAREYYEIALQDIPDIEIKDLNRLLKQDIEKLLREILGRVPCIIILIHTL